jgi:hypothetical protein
MALTLPNNDELAQTLRLLKIVNAKRRQCRIRKTANLTLIDELDEIAWDLILMILTASRQVNRWTCNVQFMADLAKRKRYGGTVVANIFPKPARVPKPDLRTVEAVVAVWMGHPECRGNIQNGKFEATGIAYRRGFYIQVFGTRRQ